MLGSSRKGAIFPNAGSLQANYVVCDWTELLAEDSLGQQ